MKTRNKKIGKLLEKYKEIALLGKINAVLGWDLSVNLPEKASEGRAQQTAFLTKLLTQKWLDKGFKKELESFSKQFKSKKKPNNQTTRQPDIEQSIIRNLEHEGKLYFQVPDDILIEFSETTSRAYMAWQKAKNEDRFKDFLPHLKKLVKLNQIIAEHLGYEENKYDALLDLYEPGLTTKKTKEIFKELVPATKKLLKTIQKSKKYEKSLKLSSNLNRQDRNYLQQDQRQISLFVLRRMNYDLDAGRMDISSHPFTETLGRNDIRITNRYKTNDFIDSLMVAMHEGGHALYEQGVSPEYENTPLDGGVSLGIHESQSRFWENQIGRSYEFIKYLTPVLHAFYPDQLYDFGVDDFFIAFNTVKPSLIRTEADEITYNLHIALRFDLEEAMVNGKIEPEDLPEIWKKKMKEYLGVTPDSDREGVLQDVHWSHGMMGYFPTYTLGNLYAAQLTETIKEELNIADLAERGELGTILSWLRTNVHQHGSLYWPDELIKKVTGESLDTKYFLNYLRDKYLSVYN